MRVNVEVTRRAMTIGALAAIFAVGCRIDTTAQPVQPQSKAPPFTLPSHDGQMVSLDGLLARGPAIVLFYRGHW